MPTLHTTGISTNVLANLCIDLKNESAKSNGTFNIISQFVALFLMYR